MAARPQSPSPAAAAAAASVPAEYTPSGEPFLPLRLRLVTPPVRSNGQRAEVRAVIYEYEYLWLCQEDPTLHIRVGSRINVAYRFNALSHHVHRKASATHSPGNLAGYLDECPAPPVASDEEHGGVRGDETSQDDPDDHGTDLEDFLSTDDEEESDHTYEASGAEAKEEDDDVDMESDDDTEDDHDHTPQRGPPHPSREATLDILREL